MGTPQLTRYCEGPVHTTEASLHVDPDLLHIEATILHTYNDEDHWFCSEACYRKWWFEKQREEGVDVNTIPLTRNGEGVICHHCDQPVLYGGLADMRCDFVNHDLTYTFCSPEHQDKFHEEQKNVAS